MKPINFPEANSKLLAGNIPNCEDLPVYKDGKHIISCWELSDAEIEKIKDTKKVYLSIFSPQTSPPVGIEVFTPFIPIPPEAQSLPYERKN